MKWVAEVAALRRTGDDSAERSGPVPGRASPGTELRAAGLFDGERFRSGAWAVRTHGTLITELVRIGESDLLPAERNRTLAPGLIDAHVHLSLDCSADPVRTFVSSTSSQLMARIAVNLDAALSAGVTTLRDCGSPTYAVDYFRAVSLRARSAPSVLASGMPITSRGGHCTFFGEGVQRDEIDAAVKRLRAARASFLKLMLTGGGLTPGSDPQKLQFQASEASLVVHRAHAVGMDVAAHVHTEEAMSIASAAGARTLEHATGLGRDGLFVRRETASAIADAGVFVVPTAAAFLMACRRGVPTIQMSVQGSKDPEALISQRMDVLRVLFAAGVRFVAGTDAGTRHIGFDTLASELRVLRDVGLTAEQALASATGVAAEALRLPDRGVLRVGARADIIALRGATPDAVLDGLARPSAVIVGGEPIATGVAA